MINFNEEIKKFKPSLEMQNIEEDSMADLLDIIKQMRPKKEQENKTDKE